MKNTEVLDVWDCFVSVNFLKIKNWHLTSSFFKASHLCFLTLIQFTVSTCSHARKLVLLLLDAENEMAPLWQLQLQMDLVPCEHSSQPWGHSRNALFLPPTSICNPKSRSTAVMTEMGIFPLQFCLQLPSFYCSCPFSWDYFNPVQSFLELCSPW